MFLVGLGANLASRVGGPRDTLLAALRAIEQTGLRITAQSRFFRSAAYPTGSGPDFVNAAVVVAGAIAPERLLAELHRIEADLDRQRLHRWGPRSCDLDLLAAGSAILPDPATQARWTHLPPEDQTRLVPDTLILPHPRLQDRAFVLVPLAEIAPGWRHPVLGRTVCEMLADLPEAACQGLAPL